MSHLPNYTADSHSGIRYQLLGNGTTANESTASSRDGIYFVGGDGALEDGAERVTFWRVGPVAVGEDFRFLDVVHFENLYNFEELFDCFVGFWIGVPYAFFRNKWPKYTFGI